jgi:hypothetical protein
MKKPHILARELNRRSLRSQKTLIIKRIVINIAPTLDDIIFNRKCATFIPRARDGVEFESSCFILLAMNSSLQRFCREHRHLNRSSTPTPLARSQVEKYLTE